MAEELFESNDFTVTTSFRHTPELERAIWKAAQEKRVSKTHIIYCCLTGAFNLNRYLAGFDEEDLKWCYERKLELLRKTQAK